MEITSLDITFMTITIVILFCFWITPFLYKRILKKKGFNDKDIDASLEARGLK
jgi:hypothetical protein